MRKAVPGALLLTVAAIGLSGCGEQATLPVEAGQGPTPQLPPPNPTWLPTVNIASVEVWAAGERPTAAAGLAVEEYAGGLDHPRWLEILPNGDVLVAESAEPPEGEGVDDGIVKQARGWVQGVLMGRAGASVPSADRITLLRDGDGDGRVDTRAVFVENLFSPFGMALVGDTFYVANADAIVSFPYEPGQTRITAPPTKVMDLPGGPRNHHWTKGLIASRDGTKLYAAVGSNSNVGENGMDEEEGRAAIWEVDIATGQGRIFGSGLRNPVGMAWNPDTGELWTAVNERDEIGSDLVPDYITSVRDGGFYGWPYSYFGQTVDERIEPPRPDLVQKAIKPDYAMGAHTASLGLSFADGNRLPESFANGAFVGQHGSWNRDPPSGYKVVFVPFESGRPSGPVVDVLTGFLDADGNAQGRPVGVAIDRQGSLLVADDVGNRIWRVSADQPAQARADARP